jgi:hypothetical protein
MTLHQLTSPGAAPDVAYPWWIFATILLGAATTLLTVAFIIDRKLAKHSKPFADSEARFMLWVAAVVVGVVGGGALGLSIASSSDGVNAAAERTGWAHEAAAYLSDKYVTPITPKDAIQLAADHDVTSIVRGRITKLHIVETSGDDLVLATWKLGDGYTEVPHRKGH